MRHSACSFFKEALTFHLLKVCRLGPRLNRDVFRGLSTSGLQVILPAVSRKAPARNVLVFREVRNLLVTGSSARPGGTGYLSIFRCRLSLSGPF
ncbi:hypothetical protein GA049_11645 [Escherichia coli]|nr:hypothetical protein [Escherichia coli]